MMTRRTLRAALLIPVILTGCATPFASRITEIDWTARPEPGTITVSDPKMYRREALINERRDEVAWLDQLLVGSRTLDFKPEILREVEQITAISAALGLNFDPASGAGYRRSQETGGLQQGIDTMRLQLQLDQLKRDAEIVRSRFEGQTEPLNADLGKLGATGTAASPTTTVAAVDQLKAAIDRLNAGLASRLDVDGKPAALANSTVNPTDVFRDRSAYRDVIKTARNAASLDELHDLDGASLIRLTFQTTILPDRKHGTAPGVIQMRIIRPRLDQPAIERLYKGWLDHINARLNVETSEGWQRDEAVLRSPAADSFETVEYRYAQRGKPASGPVPAPPTCPGLIVGDAAAVDPRCATLTFAVPRFVGGSPQAGASSSLATYLNFFHPDTGDAVERQNDEMARTTLATQWPALVQACGLPQTARVAEGSAPNDVQRLSRHLALARIRAAGGDVLAGIDRRARRMLADRGITAPADERIALVSVRTARARMLLSTLEQVAYQGCAPDRRSAFRNAAATIDIPAGFGDLLNPELERVAVYEIGPREQVQQVSTVARAANSLALAVSIAASAPGSGVAANAAGGYSKQAMGRAAALERVPSLVGYSLATDRTFGWVVGPRATIDPKGKIDLEHSLRTYDLSVDLSVPSWWPSFQLETTTGWAPGTRAIVNGRVPLAPAAALRTMIVRMSPNDADFAALTSRVSLGGIDERRRASLDLRGLQGQRVSACRPTTLMVGGDNVWRTTVAVVAGRRLGPDAISVAPDMSGILLDVPALDELIGDVGEQATLPLTILTPYGEAAGQIDYARKPASGCKAEVKPADGPTVASAEPTIVKAPAPLTFTVRGTKLDQITRVGLNGQTGDAKPGTGGKSLTVTFTREQTEGLPVSRTVPLSLFKGDDKVAERSIEVTANDGKP